MMKCAIALMLVGVAGAAHAQTDPVQKYIESAFSAMDTNGDRQVSRLEFDTFMLKRMQVQQAAFEASFAAADVNSDGFIDKREARINDQLSDHFAGIDNNGDNKISREELGAALVGALQLEAEAAGAVTRAAPQAN